MQPRPRPSYARRAILGQQDSARLDLTYGVAHLGKSLFWYASELLFAFFLTNYAGLSAIEMGNVIALGFVASAAMDVATGLGLRRTLTNARAAGRLQILGAILCSGTMLLVLVCPLLPAPWRFAYSLVAGLAFRLTYAIYDVPQNALMALGTTDARSRARISAMRIWFSGTATLIVAAAVGPLVALQGSHAGLQLLMLLGLVFATVAIGSAWALHRGLGAAPSPVIEAAAPMGSERWGAEFWLLILVMFATAFFTPIFSKLEPYFAADVLRSPWWGGVVVVLMSIGIIAGQPFWRALAGRWSSAVTMQRSALIQIVALLVFGLADGHHPAASALAAFLFGLGNGGVGMGQWAAFGNAIARAGPGRAAIGYGLFSATAKLSLAAGGLFLGAVLARAGAGGAATSGIVLAMAALPALGALIVALVAVALERAAEAPAPQPLGSSRS